MTLSVTESCLLHGPGFIDTPSDDYCVAWKSEAKAFRDPYDCLRTSIPVWAVPYPRIMACFHCCMSVALNASGLLSNYNMMTAWSKSEGTNPWHNGHFDIDYRKKHRHSFGIQECVDKYEATSAMMSDLSFIRLAHMANFYYSSDWMVASISDDTALAVVQGWTAKNRQALPAVHTIDSNDSPTYQITLLLMGDQDLPEQSWTDTVMRHSPVRRIGVHNPHPGAVRALGPRLFAFPRGVRSMCDWDTILGHPEGYNAQMRRVRPRLLHCSCIGLSRHSERRSKIQTLQRNGFRCHAECPMGVAAREYLHSKFVFSPRGSSRQNFRDWEALQSGAIPLIDHDDALAELYDGLPVVTIRNWSRVTPSFLNTVWDMMQHQSYDAQRMYLPFWLGRVLRT